MERWLRLIQFLFHLPLDLKVSIAVKRNLCVNLIPYVDRR